MRRSFYFPMLCLAVLLPTLLCAIYTPWRLAALAAMLLEVLLLLLVYRMLFKP